MIVTNLFDKIEIYIIIRSKLKNLKSKLLHLILKNLNHKAL